MKLSEVFEELKNEMDSKLSDEEKIAIIEWCKEKKKNRNITETKSFNNGENDEKSKTNNCVSGTKEQELE